MEADLAHFKGDYESAITNLIEYLTTELTDYSAWFNLGFAYMKLHKYDEAVDSFNKVIDIKPDAYFAWSNLGISYSILKKYDLALAAFKKATEIKSDDDGSWFDLGLTYLKLNRHKEAIEAWKKAVEIKPDKHEAWYNLGLAYFDLKEYDKAIESFKKVLEIKHDFHQAWSQLGFIYPLLDRYDEAITAFKKVIEIIPTEELAWTGLGSLYIFLFSKNEQEGDKTVSLHYLKSSLQCMPHITEHQGIFGSFALVLKELIKEKRINAVEIVLDEIEKAGQKELLEFLSPYSNLIKYLETKDREIIDRLKREDRVIVEEMLKLLEEKTGQETKQKKTKGKKMEG